jgi:folylpolyglutamate synthase/dihydropteroate synthase
LDRLHQVEEAATTATAELKWLQHKLQGPEGEEPAKRAQAKARLEYLQVETTALQQAVLDAAREVCSICELGFFLARSLCLLL